MSIVDYYDQSELVDNSIHTVVKSLIEGEVLVLLILVLLLGDFRGSLSPPPPYLFVCWSLSYSCGTRAFGQSHFTRRARHQHRNDG